MYSCNSCGFTGQFTTAVSNLFNSLNLRFQKFFNLKILFQLNHFENLKIKDKTKMNKVLYSYFIFYIWSLRYQHPGGIYSCWQAYAFKLPKEAPHNTSYSSQDAKGNSWSVLTQSRWFSRLSFLSLKVYAFRDLGFMQGSQSVAYIYAGPLIELLISKALHSWRYMPSASAFLLPFNSLILVSRFSLFNLPLRTSFTFPKAQQCI